MTNFLAIMSMAIFLGIASLWMCILYQYLNTPDPTPYCPHCDETLIETDSYDIDINDDKIIVEKVGYCPCCGKQYAWITEFEKTKDDDIREVE